MSKESKITIAEKLKHYRHFNCLSQEKLAEISGVSIRTIQRIEEGQSTGSGYTIDALAKSLNIHPTELLHSDLLNSTHVSDENTKLKILNFSAIAMLFVPLGNIIIPAYIYWKNRDEQKIKDIGSKIISFQLIWTFGTLLFTVLSSIILLPMVEGLRSGGIPLFVPIYFISALLNICFVFQFAVNINRSTPFLESFPNML